MGIKQHQVPQTFNATSRRVTILAKHIAQFLKARQAQAQAKRVQYQIRYDDIEDALDAFVDPSAFKPYKRL